MSSLEKDTEQEPHQSPPGCRVATQVKVPYVLTIWCPWRHGKCWCGGQGLTAAFGGRENPAICDIKIRRVGSDGCLKSA